MFEIESQIAFGLINIAATVSFLLTVWFFVKTISALLRWWKAEKSFFGFSLLKKILTTSDCSEADLSRRKTLFRNVRYTLAFFFVTAMIVLLFSHGGWNKIP